MRGATWAAAAIGAVIAAASFAQAASCRAQVGAAKAAIYVDRCKEVSPATHPPCNAANTCELIISEIKRGCQVVKDDTDAPDYCGEYDDE